MSHTQVKWISPSKDWEYSISEEGHLFRVRGQYLVPDTDGNLPPCSDLGLISGGVYIAIRDLLIPAFERGAISALMIPGGERV